MFTPFRFLLVTGCFVFIPFFAHAASYTVTTADDEADGSESCLTANVNGAGGDDTNTDCSLREAVIAANAGSEDTIVLPAGTYTLDVGSDFEDLAAEGDLDITDSDATTITGAGSGTTIIDGGSIDRVFEVSGALTMSDVTIQGGSVTGQFGGGIYVDGTLTMDDTIVTANYSDELEFDAGGSGIQCYTGGTLTITDSTISSNGQNFHSSYGGGLGILNCDVDIQRTTIDQNNGYEGGGIYVQYSENAYTFSLSDSTISNNDSQIGGGIAHYSENASDEVTLDLSALTFTGNGASSYGGAYEAWGSANMTNVTFIDNDSAGHGGAIYVENQSGVDLSLAHVTITRNFADADDNGTGNGGGIYIPSGDPSVTIKGSVLNVNAEGDRDGDSLDWVYNDCHETSGGLDSLEYSLIGTTSNCTPDAESNNTTLQASVFYTADLSDFGGEVQVQGAYIEETTVDVVPEAECDDAAGNPLTRDARGYTRPENEDCDIGAWEVDQTDPTVTISSGTDTIECAVDTWTDAGATASDNFDTTVTTASLTSGSVIEETVDEYTITYTSEEDYEGNQGTNTRTVTVQDTTDPVVSVTGDDATLTAGESYTDAGATATDGCDDDVTVSTSGTVDTDTAGTYTLTYTATDDSENAGTATRTVTVVAAEEETVETDPVVTVRTNGKFVRVFEDGVRVQQKKIGPSTVKRKYRKIVTRDIFPNTSYQNVVVLRVGKQKAKVVVFRLTENNRLRKKATRSFEFTKRNRVRLKVKRAKKRIIATVGKKAVQVQKRYRLKTNGRLKTL